MFVAFLLIIVILNIALTLMLYLKHSAKRDQEKIRQLKLYVQRSISKFNHNSERNFSILEEKLSQANLIIKKLDHYISKSNEIEVNMDLNSPKKDASKSFVQNAYSSSKKKNKKSNHNVKNNNFIKTQANLPDNNHNLFNKQINRSKILFENNITNDLQKKFSENQNIRNFGKLTKNKSTLNQNDKMLYIARLIGEGRTPEEISDLANISISEFKLFTTILKNQIGS